MRKLFLVIGFVLTILPEAPKQTTFKVIAIADGDSFSILKDNQKVRIRIDGIDAPEKGMPYYAVSKKYLSDLCFGKMVTVKTNKTDRYGREVAHILTPDGKDVSAAMIKAGLAWHYKHYSSDKTLSNLEISARKQKIGLWKDKNPIAPWEIRKLHRRGISTKTYFKSGKKPAVAN